MDASSIPESLFSPGYVKTLFLSKATARTVGAPYLQGVALSILASASSDSMT
jgi:hypothetical protein